MSCRTRILAAVTLLMNCLAGHAAWAQATNLEAGKSASQLFAGTCTACHKSPRGLLKTVSPGSLSDFLREHYTTSSDMASQLATFLISNGASDRQAKQGADAKQGGGNDQTDRQGRRQRNAPSQEAARPDADSAPPPENGRQGHRRFARPGEGADEARPSPDAQPAQAAVDRNPDGRKQRLGKHGRPGAEEAPTAEPPKAEPGTSDQAKEETGKPESATIEGTRPADDNRSNEARPGDVKPSDIKSSDAKPNDRPEASRMEPAKDAGGSDKPMMRRDPVPSVTPAPSSAAMTIPAPASPDASAPPKAPSAAAEPPAVTASAPAPSSPAGPPAPPISQ